MLIILQVFFWQIRTLQRDLAESTTVTEAAREVLEFKDILAALDDLRAVARS